MMYRRMGPKELEKIIEENKKWEKLSSGAATGVAPVTKQKEGAVDAKNALNHVEAILTMDDSI